MHKMIPIRNTDANFPIFPNKVNPSNSVAIGGVFDITTPAIKSHVDQVEASIEQQKLEDDKINESPGFSGPNWLDFGVV